MIALLVPWVAASALAAGPPPASSAEDAANEARHLTNIRQVTSGFARAGEGYFRPDGQAIIFQATPRPPIGVFRDTRPGDDDYQIFTAELKPDATPRLVSTGKGKTTCSYYRPNGRAILFASTHLDPALNDPDRTKSAKGPAYSRSEKYRWDFDPAMDIFQANPDGSNLVRLTETPGYDAEGSYSPDGSHILFTSMRDGDPEIYEMDADGKNPRRITKSPGYDGGPFYSPDGKRIVYRSDRKGDDLLQLYVNNVEGTDERPLTNNRDVNWGPYFFKDSRHIIYATSRQGHQNYELYLIDADTGADERITFRDGFDGLPAFSPDGSKLLWTSKGRTADATSQLFVADFSLEPRPATPTPTPEPRP